MSASRATERRRNAVAYNEDARLQALNREAVAKFRQWPSKV